MRMGWTYTSMSSNYAMLDIIATAIESSGPANFDTHALFETANSYTLMVEGVPRFSYDETKRYPYNYFGIYEAQAAEEDLFRIDPEMYYYAAEP